MAGKGEVTVSMQLQQGYQFLVDFHMDGVGALTVDEPPPTGAGQGPGPSHLLAAAIAACLSASALFCLRKAHIGVRGMQSSAAASLVRDDRGRLRVGAIAVQIEPEVETADTSRIGRCLEIFEDYCVVTQSVRAGLDVSVEVRPAGARPPQ